MKLVLFDIDGTLIYHISYGKQVGFPRFTYAIKKAYGIDVSFTNGYHGWTDKQIIRSAVPQDLFPHDSFEARWDRAKDALYEYAQKQSASGKTLYGIIPDAVQLVNLLYDDPRYTVGLLTGNIKKMAYWKLAHTGIPNIFSIGVFGDDADDRIALAQSVFEKVRKELHVDIQGSDITVIGDAIYDVRCGKAIGARTIAVSTGHTTGIGGIHDSGLYIESLKQEHPDILVPSLMDKRVRDYFRIY